MSINAAGTIVRCTENNGIGYLLATGHHDL